MSTPVKFFGVILGVPALIIGLLIVNAFIYPFSSKNPNFSDVEQAFAKLQFPADWQEISSSENRGIAGRGCDPFNSSGCFHKRKSFKVNNIESTRQTIKSTFESNGCQSVVEDSTYEGNSNSTPKTLIQISCQTSGGVFYGASLSQQKGEASVTARTY